jgi:hypothetical protein
MRIYITFGFLFLLTACTVKMKYGLRYISKNIPVAVIQYSEVMNTVQLARAHHLSPTVPQPYLSVMSVQVLTHTRNA